MELDINKLIEVAEFIAYDDEQLGFAKSIQRPVQDLSVNGKQYRMYITVTAMDAVEERSRKMIPYGGNV